MQSDAVQSAGAEPEELLATAEEHRRAQHLVGAAFLRRRFAYGAGLGARGGRAPARAARQLASSAVGAPLAALRGDAVLAMERATRAAENAGVLLAPVLARR